MAAIQKQAEEEAERKEREKGRWGEEGRSTRTSRRSVARSPVVKVLTSATFIRGVLGIMKRVIK